MKKAAAYLRNSLFWAIVLANLLCSVAFAHVAQGYAAPSISSPTSVETTPQTSSSTESSSDSSSQTSYSTESSSNSSSQASSSVGSDSSTIVHTVNLIYGENLPDVSLTVIENATITLPPVDRPGYVVSTWISQSTKKVYTMEQLSALPIVQADTFTAQWTRAIPEDGKLDAGIYYLSPGVRYTTSLDNGWSINGGVDATSYMQGVGFYVSAAGNYTISAAFPK